MYYSWFIWSLEAVKLWRDSARDQQENHMALSKSFRIYCNAVPRYPHLQIAPFRSRQWRKIFAIFAIFTKSQLTWVNKNYHDNPQSSCLALITHLFLGHKTFLVVMVLGSKRLPDYTGISEFKGKHTGTGCSAHFPAMLLWLWPSPSQPYRFCCPKNPMLRKMLVLTIHKKTLKLYMHIYTLEVQSTKQVE